MLLAKSRPMVVICIADGSHFARERLMVFTLWHPDAVSGSHPPHLFIGGHTGLSVNGSPLPSWTRSGHSSRGSAPFVVILESSKWLVYSFWLEARTPRSRSCGKFRSRRLARLKFSR